MSAIRAVIGLLLVLGYTLGANEGFAAERNVCARTVQGNVAWDYSGNTQWSQANVEKLCSGAEDTTEPARCFDMVMHTGIDHGGGTRWVWQDALDLCRGTRDYIATVDCFRSRIRNGLRADEARDACRWDIASASTLSSNGGEAVVLTPHALTELASPATWFHSEASAVAATRVARSAARPALSSVAALQEFELTFHGGDHKINRISVLADDRFADLAFNDQDGEDRFNAWARWAVFSRGTGGEVSASGGGRMDLRLEPGPADHVLVLTGFRFQRLGGTDANVRMIGIRLDPEELFARVWLIDDQGFDFRDFDDMLAWSAAGGLVLPPLGHVIAGAAAAPPATPGNMRPYSVQIQYAWIPESLVRMESSASGTTAFNTNKWKPEGPVALQGFEFAFGNSDHHLGGFGVILGGEHHNVLYRDSDWGDPIQWAVSYAVLDERQRR